MLTICGHLLSNLLNNFISLCLAERDFIMHLWWLLWIKIDSRCGSIIISLLSSRLCVINWVLKVNALLLLLDLLLLLHLKFLVYLLSKLEVKFGGISHLWYELLLLRDLIPSWGTSVALYWWDIMYAQLRLFRGKRSLAVEVWGERLIHIRFVSNRLFSLVVAHKHGADCNSGCCWDTILWLIERISSLLTYQGHFRAMTRTCCSHFHTLSICWTHIERYLNDAYVLIIILRQSILCIMVVNMHRRYFLSHLLLLLWVIVLWSLIANIDVGATAPSVLLTHIDYPRLLLLKDYAISAVLMD